MRPMILTALSFWLALTGMSVAQSANSSPVVVELYTSQGCSSCPAADAVLANLAKRDDVIALALHVDYWDYIGWKDTLGDPAYTKRQRAYARVAGARTIYTPQMIIGGMDHIVGVRPGDVETLIKSHAGKAPQVHLSVGRKGSDVQVRAKAVKPLSRGTIVQLVRYSPLDIVAIGRGENAGRTIEYVNTVMDLKKLTDWNGKSDLSLNVKTEGKGHFVVIIQEPGPGPVLAAARLP
ncbi:MAG: DUF1223 domain-containing protein [Paracoccaceae bacterium]|nr:DUF1223 domain-containing protein [Paracoccaceae bacterium]MDH5530293.1 DUF1223 domain-containing protein [Paracoccaceae bacterium]